MKGIFLDLLEAGIIGLVVFSLVYFLVGQLMEVTGSSMQPTLENKEQIFAEKISVKMEPPSRGDIVIFKHPENNKRLLIKRVVGLPNEQIEILNGVVFINEKQLAEEYINTKNSTQGKLQIHENEKYTIPENQYLLLGDNREESSDSRQIGFIPRDLIIAKVFAVYFPLKNFRLL